MTNRQFIASSSAPEKALDSAKSVYTSKVVDVDIDFNYINQNFDFGFIKIEAESKADYKKLVIESSNILKKSGVLLSSYHYKKESSHFFMTKKGAAKNIVSDNINLTINYEQLPFVNPCFAFIHTQLLCSALPSLMNEELICDRRAFYSGESYYRASYIERKENGINVVVCIESKISPDWTMSPNTKPTGHNFIATTATFTLLSDVENFSPRNSKMAKRKAKMLIRDKFKLSDQGFIVPTNQGKEAQPCDDDIYVKGSIEEDTNNRTDAYLIDHDKIKLDNKGILNESTPENSRAAHAYKFLDDLSETYEGAVRVTFGKTEFDRCYSGSKLKTKSNNEYKAIMQVLSGFSIRIINKTINKDILPQHIEQLEELSTYQFSKPKMTGNIRYFFGDEKNTEGKPELILLITDGADYYKRNKTLIDPYLEYKGANPDKIIQSVEYGSLFRFHEIRDNNKEVIDILPSLAGRKYDKKNNCIKGKCSTLDCLLVQLHLKLEVQSNQLYFDRQAGQFPKGFSFIYPFREKFSKDEYIDKEVKLAEGEDLTEEPEGEDTPFSGYRYCSVITNGMNLIFEEVPEYQLEEIKSTLRKNDHLVFGKQKRDSKNNIKYTHERHPLMINMDTGQYMIFVRTNANAMPNHEMLEAYRHSLIEGRKKAVQRDWLENYINREDIDKNVVDALSALLDQNKDDKAFFYQQIQLHFRDFKPKIGARLSNSQKTKILDDIERELKIRWYSAIKTTEKEMKKLISHQEGFMFSRTERCYFAGNIGSFQSGSQDGFSKIYKIITSPSFDLPDDMDQWFLSMSVRNRQTTVYPFIFQHVKEYAAMIALRANVAVSKTIEIKQENEQEYTDAELDAYADMSF